MTDSQPAALLDDAARGAIFGLFALLAVKALSRAPQLPMARLSATLSLGMCVQVASSTPWVEAHAPWLWQIPLIAVSVANAVLFWLYVRALFDDEFALSSVHAAVWFGVAALTVFACLSRTIAGAGSPIAIAARAAQRAMPLVFALLAAYAAARHWRDDLVEPRRRLRAFVVVTGVAYTVAMVIARLQSADGGLVGATAVLDVAVLLMMVSVLALRLLRVEASEVFLPASRQAPPPTVIDAEAAGVPSEHSGSEAPSALSVEETSLAAALNRVMTEEHAYRDDDLSPASLARRLSVPEYRLRRLINQRLGHRNFTAFVNGHRLAEACSALADPAQREVSVLAIALDAGWQSIGPFNRAFKAATGLTPTEFRRQKLAAS